MARSRGNRERRMTAPDRVDLHLADRLALREARRRWRDNHLERRGPSRGLRTYGDVDALMILRSDRRAETKDQER